MNIQAKKHWWGAALLMLAACASEIPRNHVPHQHVNRAEVINMPGVRVWGDEISDILHQDLVRSIQNEKPGLFPRDIDGAFQYRALSLSGGGDHGAFGAGFMKGWTESGSRPTFKIVSGISTGALIAPFAMLGDEYDGALQAAYTKVSATDIYKSRSLLGAYWRESLADSHPLEHLVHKFVTDEVIDAIAQAHRDGQRLFIGTTNLDAQRPVIWNMGIIANNPGPNAHDFFRKVLVASASIPVLFPPVYIDVEFDGTMYEDQSTHPYDQDEMKRTFDIGFEMGRTSKGWRSTPPGF